MRKFLLICLFFILSESGFVSAQTNVILTDVSGDPGQTVTANLIVENTMAICAVDIKIDFPESAIDSIWAVRVGRLAPANPFYLAGINQSDGHFRIAFTYFPPSALPAGTDPIIQLNMRLKTAIYGRFALDVIESGLVLRACSNETLPITVEDGELLIQPPNSFPNLVITETGHDFGQVQVNGTKDWTFQISNNGADPLNVSSVLSSNPAFQAVAPSFPRNIAGQASVTVTVRFLPTTPSDYSGKLTIASNDPLDGTVQLNLSGQGFVPIPDIKVDLSTYDFGSIILGNTSDRLLTISNTGSGNLTISSVVSSNPTIFYLTNLDISQPVAPGGSIQPTVYFKPAALGTATAQITITSNDPDESPIILQLTGNGVNEAPQISLTSAAVNFGNVRVGSPLTKTLRIFSIGNVPLQITNLQVTNSVFSLTPVTLPINLVTGAFVDLSLTFAPTQSGAQQGLLTITSNDAGSATKTVDLTGTGVAPEINPSPATRSFGTVNLGQFSDGQLTLQNLGNAALTITNIASTSPDFKIQSTHTLPATIAAGGQLNITVRFQPAVEGARSGAIRVNSDDVDEAILEIPVSGTGYVPRPIFLTSARSHDFGQVKTDNTGIWDFTISNMGDAALTISAIESSMPEIFSVSSPTFPQTILPAGSALTVTVRFSPQNPTAYDGILTIRHNDANQPSHTVTLNGIGLLPPADLIVRAGQVNLTDGGQSVPVDITVQTLKSVRSLILEIRVPDASLTIPTAERINTGALFSNFSFTNLGGGVYTLALSGGTMPADTANIIRLNVTPRPTIFAGTYPIAISGIIATDGSGQLIGNYQKADGSLILTGAPDIDTPASAYPFGNVSVNQTAERTFSLSNLGKVALQVQSVVFGAGTGEFTVTSPAFPQVIGINGSLNVTVRFAPTQPGNFSRTLTINNNDPLTPALTIGFSGVGVALTPEISLSTATINFGSLAVGSHKVESFSVQNQGLGDLQISGVQISNPAFKLLLPSSFPQTVAANQTLNIVLDYMPSRIGTESGTLTISSNDSDESAVVVNMQGTGLQADIQITSGCDVGPVLVGQDGFCDFQICNTGNINLNISAIASNLADFGIVSPVAFPVTIPPQNCTTVRVEFSPAAPGKVTGRITITSDDPDELLTTVNVLGEGLAPQIGFSTQSLNFGFVEVSRSADLQLTVQNTGTAPLHLTGFSFQTSDGVFNGTITGEFPPAAIAPGGSVVLQIRLTALSSGSLSGALRLTSDAYNRPQSAISLSATGYQCIVVLSESSHSFGQVQVAQSRDWNLVVSNACPVSPLVIQNVTFTDANYTVSPRNFPLSMPINGTQILVVSYRPAAAGSHLANMTLQTDRGNFTISLAGEAIAPNLNPTSQSHIFGTVDVGVGQSHVFQVSNLGTAAATLGIAKNFKDPVFSILQPASFPQTISAGATFQLTLNFLPAADKNYADTLTLTTNDPLHPTLTFVLAGTGVSRYPDIHIDERIHDFGDIGTGRPGIWAFRIFNLGEKTLRVDSLRFRRPEFSVRYLTGTADIPALGNSLIQITLQPTPTTPLTNFSDTLRIYSDDPDESPLRIPLMALVVGIEDEPDSQADFVLHQNYPNPFLDRTAISFDLPTPAPVMIAIFNSSGQFVYRFEQERFAAGHHTIYWNGQNQQGQKIPSGIYFYSLTTLDQQVTKRLSLLTH